MAQYTNSCPWSWPLCPLTNLPHWLPKIFQWKCPFAKWKWPSSFEDGIPGLGQSLKKLKQGSFFFWFVFYLENIWWKAMVWYSWKFSFEWKDSWTGAEVDCRIRSLWKQERKQYFRRKYTESDLYFFIFTDRNLLWQTN